MQQISDLTSADRYELCLHCGEALGTTATKDHVPSRGLLTAPYPENLPTVDICAECNSGFSKDEEYFFTLLGCVLSGSADPDDQSDLRIAERLRRSPELARRIADQQIPTLPIDGETVWWKPESVRIHNVVVKNARGHVMHETGVPLHRSPDSVAFSALSVLTADQRLAFERGDSGDPARWHPLPEIGTRALTRVVTSADLEDGWVVVQPGRYRYSVEHRDSATVVRAVIHDYFAAEVSWTSE